jgi:RNA polymerase sigma-70 factor (ECF subfamily)
VVRVTGVTVVSEPSFAAASVEFSHFYRREYQVVVGLAYVMSGSRVAAEELAQEGFAAAYHRWDRIGRYDDPGAWVRHVVANRSISRWRRLAAERRALARLAGAEPRIAELPETHAEVWSAVRRLSSRQAIATALYYYADLPVDAIAGLMECTAGTVKTHLARARERLRQALAEEEPA